MRTDSHISPIAKELAVVHCPTVPYHESVWSGQSAVWTFIKHIPQAPPLSQFSA